jgi:hypothetical protein
MTLEEMRLRVLEAEARVEIAEQEVIDTRAAIDIAQKQAATASAERDAERARAEKAETRIVKMEVDALVGVKITPAERDDFVELALTNRRLFESQLANRREMTILRQIVPPATDDGGLERLDTNGRDLAKAIFGEEKR